MSLPREPAEHAFATGGSYVEQLTAHHQQLPDRAWHQPSPAPLSACRWAAVLGVILAVSRGFITEPGTAFDPELAMLEVVAHTHYLPRHWRGRAHTREVQQQFMALFQFKVGSRLQQFRISVLGWPRLRHVGTVLAAQLLLASRGSWRCVMSKWEHFIS